MVTAPLSPGSTIGILGGGQLGRMLAMAAARLGLHTHIYCAKENAPAFEVARYGTVADFDDDEALTAFAKGCDAVTFEFENIPLAAADLVAKHKPLFPSRRALDVAQDRCTEKAFLDQIGVGVAPWKPIDKLADLEPALAGTGRPALLKTRRLGYDGKGQVRIDPDSDLEGAWQAIGSHSAILEKMITFEREISVVLVRDRSENVRCYDIPENVHSGGILRSSQVPADLPHAIGEMAREIATEIAMALDYCGVLAVEFFVTDGHTTPTLLVNEIAPRVHNSGHWTLDACLVSQFENHIRAVAGWPLGSTERHSNAVMTNLLGDMVTQWHDIAPRPDTALHLYGKTGIAPGRKLGHTTQLSPRSDNGA